MKLKKGRRSEKHDGRLMMSKTTKRRPDLAPVPWLLLAFLLGVSAGLLLSMSQTAEALALPLGELSSGCETERAEQAEPESTLTVSPSGCHLSQGERQEEPEPEEPTQPELTSIGLYTVTAYCPCELCCGKTDGITATGTVATEGRTIAVDPGVIPYGSVVYFEGVDGCIGGYIAEDCGGAIKGNRIDLFCAEHETALEWGVRELEVYTCETE